MSSSSEESPPSDSPPPPPPPSDSSSSSSSNDSNSQSPPPPSDNNASPPPPPSKNNNDSSSSNDDSNGNNNNNNNDNNNDNNNSHDNNKSPPPPPKSSSSSDGDWQSPPPPPPPPPPPHYDWESLPSPKHKSPSENNDSTNDSDKAMIAGVAAAAGLLLLVMIVFLISCCKRKKRRPRDQMRYYRDNSHGAKSSDYYHSGQQQNWQQNNAQYTDHLVKMPPPPTSAGVSSEQSWAIAPPPPPPMMCSSEMSSAGFSGPHNPPLPPPHPSMALGFNQSSFTYEDLAAATGGFLKSNLLGQGGFGYVHKGVLPNGKEIAVKSLKSNSGQGEREFQAEVEIISRVHHRHLVSLVGYCIAGEQRMLVYEFVSNNTLEYHLHGTGRPPMDFPTRLKIALGSAKGFAYLHEDCHPRIIHRDIKAANILLDDNFEAKVADFGLAKLSADNNTHVSTRIMGTFGYLAPEYASSGKLTEKSDVYSYGVVLLELITGRRPIEVHSDDDSLVDWARPILMRATEGGDYDELIDPLLEGKFDAQEMLCMVACAAASIRHSARRRPKMSQIVRALEGDVSLDDLKDGGKVGHSAMFGSNGSSEQDGGAYDIKNFKKSGLSSQEFTSSSEHGMTGEYAHSSGGESQEFGNRKRSP